MLPSGIPIDELDPGIRPQDDLFRHVGRRTWAGGRSPIGCGQTYFRALSWHPIS